MKNMMAAESFSVDAMQLSKGLSILESSAKIGLFMLTPDTTKYFPVKIEKKGELYTVTPCVMIHGVRHRSSGDSYDDLRGILKEGFRGIGGAWNSHIAEFDPAGRYGSAATNDSYPSSKHEDKYLLEIARAIPRPEARLEPFVLESNLTMHTVYRADPEDIGVVVVLKKSLTERQKRKKIQFYEKDLKHPNMRFIDDFAAF